MSDSLNSGGILRRYHMSDSLNSAQILLCAKNNMRIINVRKLHVRKLAYRLFVRQHVCSPLFVRQHICSPTCLFAIVNCVRLSTCQNVTCTCIHNYFAIVSRTK